MTSEPIALIQRLQAHTNISNTTPYNLIADDIREAIDKIEGLEADLRLAVLTAYNRGATEWAVRNYPDMVDWLQSTQAIITGKG